MRFLVLLLTTPYSLPPTHYPLAPPLTHSTAHAIGVSPNSLEG